MVIKLRLAVDLGFDLTLSKASQWACQCSVEAGRRHETSGSEKSDHVIGSTASSANTSMLYEFPLSCESPGAVHRAQMDFILETYTEPGALAAFIANSKQACSLSWKGTLPPPFWLLVARNGSGQWWSGPCILSPLSKGVCRSREILEECPYPQCLVGKDWMNIFG